MKNLFNSKISELSSVLEDLTDKLDATDKVYSLMHNMWGIFNVMDKFDDNDTIWYGELVKEIDPVLKGDIMGLASLSVEELDNVRERIRQFGKTHVPVKFKRMLKYIPILYSYIKKKYQYIIYLAIK